MENQHQTSRSIIDFFRKLCVYVYERASHIFCSRFIDEWSIFDILFDGLILIESPLKSGLHVRHSQ
jgi:hypothetical protein